MSRQADESRSRKAPAPAKTTRETKTTPYIAFHPTKEQKEFLREQEDSLEDLLGGLVSFLREGHKIQIGLSERTGAIYATLRERSDDWKTAISVSAFHAEPGMALRSLCYFVVVCHPRFPSVQLPLDEELFGW